MWHNQRCYSRYHILDNRNVLVIDPAPRDSAENGADMSYKKIGKQTVRFSEKPCITGHGNVVGEKEGQGPLGKCFDLVLDDDMYGEKSWRWPKARC